MRMAEVSNNNGPYNEVRESANIKLRFSLVDYSAMFVLIWALIPIINENSAARVLVVISSVIEIINVISKRRNGAATNYFILSLLMIGTYIIHNLIGNGSIPIAKVINMFVFVMLGLISYDYFYNNREKYIFICKLIIALYIIVCIPSLIALSINPWVLRRASGLTVRTGIERFAGSYGFAFGCVFLVSYLVYDLHEYHTSRLGKIFTLGAIILFTYLILNSGYTTALVLTVVGIVAAMSIRKNPFKTIIIAAIVIAILIYSVPIILRYILANFDIPIVYEQKLLYISQMINPSSTYSYSDSTRGTLLQQGFDTIIQYPFFGSVILSGAEKAGGHQQIVDVLANYGVVYSLLYYYVIIGTPYRLSKADRPLCLLYIVLIVSLGFTDTIDFATMAVPLFIGPYLSTKRLSKG